MRVVLLCVGKLKEAYWKSACAEYLKRLSRYGQFEIVEVPDAPEPLHTSEALEEQVRALEGERLLAKVRTDDHVIALAIDGKGYTSESFAAHVERVSQNGRLVFVIGGSLGLSDAVYARAQERISFSSLTFPHQMMRVIFLEQLYRACRIMSNQPYHK